MALTGMQIYKNLPKTNCKECGFPTCMAFAMQVAAKQKALTDCPQLSEDAQAALSDASAPPMKLVKIGPEGKQFEMGQETVMFRHEEKFYNPAVLAVTVSDKLAGEELKKRIEAINALQFERIRQVISSTNVELWALQEVADPGAFSALLAALGNEYSGLSTLQ